MIFLKSKRLILAALSVVVIAPGDAAEVDRRDPQAQRESLVRVEATIERLKNASPEEAMPKLGEILRKTARQNIYQVEERWETHEKAKAAILAMPGHAAYFGDRLKELKSALRDQGEKNRYDSERVDCFEVMRFLPSPEIVETLGNFLSDDEDEPGPWKENQDYVDTPANSRKAAITLGQLLEKPPTQTPPLTYSKDDVETWKLWYAQVKAGNRGFQFKGSDVIHYLPAPVEDAARPAVVDRAPVVPTKVPKSNEPSDVQKQTSKPFPLVPTLAALGLAVLACGWIVVSKRRSSVA